MICKRLLPLILAAGLLLSATPARALAPAQQAGPIYIVQSGDTFWTIASRFNISVDELTAANPGIDPGALSVGQQLVIPGLEGVSGVLTTEIVPYGDTFRSLVRRTQVPAGVLRRLNHIVSPTELYAGVSLIVPQEASAAALTSQASLAPGESLLELAVRQGTSPWALAETNRLAGTWAALPGDVLYSTGGDQATVVTGLPPVFASAELASLPLKQGGTAEIRVRLNAVAGLRGALVDNPLRFFALEDGSFVALQGVHALLPPGVYPLRIEATLDDGRLQSFEQNVLVQNAYYPEDVILFVEAETIDPTVTEPEMQQIIALTASASPERFWEGIFQSPAVYQEYTSVFGLRRTYKSTDGALTLDSFHAGLDFAGGEGLSIFAPAAGKVIFAGPLTVRGNATIIDHGWGVFSGFWHQSAISVQVGDLVTTGQEIGKVGGTGRVTGPHQHWELWVNGVQVDPLDWLNQAYP